MKLEDVVIGEGEGQYESLALALQAVASAERAELDYDYVCAAMGVSFAAVSTTAQGSPGWWMTYGRDAFLEPAARLFGFRLRELHPPEVGVDMIAAEQFGQHFELSYKPLIIQALENGQPVLAWQGWPEFGWAFWGVITYHDAGVLEGTTLWAGGQRQRLVQPALQCYVVEEYEPLEPTLRAMLATAMRHADGYLNRVPFGAPSLEAGRPDIITGPAACDAWETWLASEDFGEPGEDPSWNEHRQHAEFLAASRESAIRFLQRMRPVVPADRQATIAEVIACCESFVGRLADSRDEEKVRSLFATGQGRQTLLEAVHAAEADERRLAMRIEELR